MPTMKWHKTHNWRPAASLEMNYSKTSQPTLATISYPTGSITDPVTAVNTKKSLPTSGPDSLLSWKVAFSCFLFNMVTIGMFKANSIIFVEYLKISGYSREIASWPFTIAGLSVIFVGPFVGVLSRHFSPRTLCLVGAFCNFIGLFATYFRTDIIYMIVFIGLVRGVGLAIVVSLIPVFLNQYFQRHRATAQGIVGAGSPLGLMVCSFLIEFGLETYALRGALLFMSGISLHAFAASIPLTTAPWLLSKKPVREANDNPAFVEDQPMEILHPPSTNSAANTIVAKTNDRPPKDGKPSKSVLREYLSVLMNGRFVMISLTFVTITNAGLIFTIVVVDYATDLGFTREQGVYILLAFSAGDVLGKLGLGWVTDKKYMGLQTYFAVTVSLSGGIFIGLPFVQPVYWVYIVALGAAGVLQGSALSLITLFYLQYLRKDLVPVAFSMHVSLAGLTSVSRPPLIGLFRDRMGSYDNLIRTIGGTLLLAATVWALERILKRIRR